MGGSAKTIFGSFLFCVCFDRERRNSLTDAGSWREAVTRVRILRLGRILFFGFPVVAACVRHATRGAAAAFRAIVSSSSWRKTGRVFGGECRDPPAGSGSWRFALSFRTERGKRRRWRAWQPPRRRRGGCRCGRVAADPAHRIVATTAVHIGALRWEWPHGGCLLAHYAALTRLTSRRDPLWPWVVCLHALRLGATNAR